MTVRVSIVGGSGYVGGELLRLLLSHPRVHVAQITSRRHSARFVHDVHPNLRQMTDLRFTAPDQLEACEVLFLALPHGLASRSIARYAGLADTLIDCSADFRLRDADAYQRTYGDPHPAPEWLGRFVYGLPERFRDDLRGASYASGVGCNAAAVILALAPLADAGILRAATVEVKVGSSEAGAGHSAASHHPERSGAVRVYRPFGHRHLAEIAQALGEVPVDLTATAIEMVRGVHLTAHCRLQAGAQVRQERDIWELYREAYGEERFIRLVASRRGLYRFPEPKILVGSNCCDVGFALDEERDLLVVIAALDNLMKGAAGSAVQSMNVMRGWPEDSGLGFAGLHPA